MWLKENWVKIWTLLLASLLVLAYIVNIYVRIKEHNLDVVDSVRLCGTAGFDSDGVKSCSNAIGRQKIPIF